MADDKKKDNSVPQIAPVVSFPDLDKIEEDRSFYNEYMRYLQGRDTSVGWSPYQLDPEEYKTYRKYEELSQGVIDNFLHGAFGKWYEKVRGVPTIAPPTTPGENISYGIGELGRVIAVGAIMSLAGTPAVAAAGKLAKTAKGGGALVTAIKTAAKGAELAQKLQKSSKLGKFGVNAVKGAIEFPVLMKVADTLIPPGVEDERPVGEKLKYDAPAGAVFHTVTRMTPFKSPLMNIIARWGATSLALDVLKGQSAFDERPDWAKIFEYGLNFAFSLSKPKKLSTAEAKSIVKAVKGEVEAGTLKPEDGQKIISIVQPYIEGEGGKATKAETTQTPTSQTPPTAAPQGAEAKTSAPQAGAVKSEGKAAKGKAKEATIEPAKAEAAKAAEQTPEQKLLEEIKNADQAKPQQEVTIEKPKQVEQPKGEAVIEQPKQPEVRTEEEKQLEVQIAAANKQLKKAKGKKGAKEAQEKPKEEQTVVIQKEQPAAEEQARLLEEIKNADKLEEPKPATPKKQTKAKSTEKKTTQETTEATKPAEEAKPAEEQTKDAWTEAFGRRMSDEEKATMSNDEFIRVAGVQKPEDFEVLRAEREAAADRVVNSLRPGDRISWNDGSTVWEVTNVDDNNITFRDIHQDNVLTYSKEVVKNSVLKGRDTSSGVRKPTIEWGKGKKQEAATPAQPSTEAEEAERVLREIADADKLGGTNAEELTRPTQGAGERGAGERGAGERTEPAERGEVVIERGRGGEPTSGEPERGYTDRRAGGSPAVSGARHEQGRAGENGVRNGGRADVAEGKGRRGAARTTQLNRIAEQFEGRGTELYNRIKDYISTRLKAKDDGIVFFAVHHEVAGNTFDVIPRKGEVVNPEELNRILSDFRSKHLFSLRDEPSQTFVVRAKKQKDGSYRYQIYSTYGGEGVPFEKTLAGKTQARQEGEVEGLKELAKQAKVKPVIISEKGDVQYSVTPQKSGAHTIVAVQNGKEIGRLNVDVPKNATQKELTSIYSRAVRMLDASIEFSRLRDRMSDVDQFLTAASRERAAESRAARKEVKYELGEAKSERRSVESQLRKLQDKLDTINKKRSQIKKTRTAARKELEKATTDKETIINRAKEEGRELTDAEKKHVGKLERKIKQNDELIKALDERSKQYSYEEGVVPLQKQINSLLKKVERLQRKEQKLQNKYNSLREVIPASALKKSFVRTFRQFFRERGLEINDTQAKKILKQLGGVHVGKQVELEIMFPDEVHGMTKYTVPIGVVGKQHSAVARLRRVANNLFPKIQDPRVVNNNRAIEAIQNKAKAEGRPLTKAEQKAIRTLKSKNAAIGDEPYNPVRVVVRDNPVIATGNALLTPQRVAERFVGAIFQAGGIRKAVAERLAQSGQKNAKVDIRNVLGVMRENPRAVLDALIRELGAKKEVDRQTLDRVVEVPLGELEAIVQPGEGGIGEVDLAAARRRRGMDIVPEDDIEAIVEAFGETGAQKAERLSVGRVKDIEDLGEYKPDLTFLSEMEARMRSGRYISPSEGARLERIIRQYRKVDADYAKYLKELWDEVSEVYREDATQFLKPDGTIDLQKVSQEAKLRADSVAMVYENLVKAGETREALLQEATELGQELKLQLAEGGKEYTIKTLDDVRAAVIDYLSAVSGEKRGRTASATTTTTTNIAKDFTEVTRKWQWGDTTQRNVPEVEQAVKTGAEQATTGETLSTNKAVRKKIGKVKKAEDVAEVIKDADKQGKTPAKGGVVLGMFYAPMPSNWKLADIVKQGSKAVREFFFGGRNNKAGKIDTVEGLTGGLDAMVFHLLDNRRIARQYVKFAKRYGKLEDIKKYWGDEFSDPEKMLDVFGGRHGVVLEAIDGIPVNFRTLKPAEGVKGLRQIYSGLKPAEFQQFELYLIARRVRAEKAKNPKINTGDMTLEKAEEIYQQFHGKYESRAQEYTKFMNYLCEQLYEAGMMPEATIKYIRQNNDYAPLNRIMQKMHATNYFGSDIDSVPTPVYRFHGSHLPIESPYASAIKFAYRTADAIAKNNLAKALVQMKDILESYKLIEPWKGNPATRPDNVIGVNVEGKIKYYKVPRDLAMYMRHIDMVKMSPMVRQVLHALQAPARIARAGVTLAPEFTFRNPIKDWLSAMVYSDVGFNPFKDIPRALASYIKKDNLYHEFIASGGSWSTMVKASKLSSVADAYAHNKKTINLAPISFLENISDAVETMTRLGMYIRARSKGRTPTQAAINARKGTIDFAVSGALMRYYTPFVAFLNPRLQGFRRLGEAFATKPVETALKGFAFASIPSIAVFLANKDDPDYWRQPAWKKNLFWLVKLPGHKKFLMVPKGDLGMIFGSTIERFLDFAYKRDESSIQSLAKDLIGNALPVSSITDLIPTSIKPILENQVNKSFFTGQRIVPESQEGLAKEYQYSEYTTPFAKLLGKKTKQSPAKIENLIRGYGGTLGKHALNIASAITQPEELKRYRAFKGDPFLRAFVSEEAIGSVSEPVKRFMDRFSRARDYYDTVSRHLRVNPLEATKYLQEEGVKEGLAEYAKMKDYYNAISKIRKKMMLFQNVAKPTEKTKQQLRDMQRLMTLIAEKYFENTGGV